MAKVLPVKTIVVMAFLALPNLSMGECGEPCERWNELQARIRDLLIPKEEARAAVVRLHGELLLRYHSRPSGADSKRCFPVEGASARDIGGKGDSGFVSKGYDFYDGNRHGGHPAFDIFITDKDLNSRHDVTGRPVRIRAFAPGVVVGLNKGWLPGSDLRGGNYIWIFTPSEELYCYYAHLEEVVVEVGQWVEAGETLGTVGRTGKNAYPSRSPTHLHFMCLKFDGGRMRPANTYRELLQSSCP